MEKLNTFPVEGKIPTKTQKLYLGSQLDDTGVFIAQKSRVNTDEQIEKMRLASTRKYNSRIKTVKRIVAGAIAALTIAGIGIFVNRANKVSKYFEENGIYLSDDGKYIDENGNKIDVNLIELFLNANNLEVNENSKGR